MVLFPLGLAGEVKSWFAVVASVFKDDSGDLDRRLHESGGAESLEGVVRGESAIKQGGLYMG